MVRKLAESGRQETGVGQVEINAYQWTERNPLAVTMTIRANNVACEELSSKH
jgi:hypothetical protein